MAKLCNHEWIPGTNARIWRCVHCGATAIRAPLEAGGPNWKARGVALATVVAIVVGVILFA